MGIGLLKTLKQDVAVDVFSHYLFAIPLRRKHKEFTVSAVKLLLEQFEVPFGQLLEFIQVDDGGDIKNTKVLPFWKNKVLGTSQHILLPKRQPLWKERTEHLKQECGTFDHEGKKEWIYVLQILLQGVNQSVNRTICMAPEDVTNENEEVVFTKLYGHPHKVKRE